MAQTNKLTPAEVADIVNLYALGLPVGRIARHFNISNAAVRYHVKGIEPDTINKVLTRLSLCAAMDEAA